MRVSFSHNLFVNRGEIANVVCDLLRNGSRKSCETEEKKLKSVDKVSLLVRHWLPLITQYRLQFLDF